MRTEVPVAVVIPPGFQQVTLRMACIGVTDPMLCTFGTKTVGGGDFFTTEAEAIRAMLVGPGKLFDTSMFSNEYTFTGVDVVKAIIDSEPVMTSSYASVVGSSAINTPPANSAILVKKGTGRGGRRNRGRFFFPPMFLSEANVNPAGVLTGPGVGTLQQRLNTMLSDLAASERGMVILHNDINVEPTTVTSLLLDLKLATQRRRMR